MTYLKKAVLSAFLIGASLNANAMNANDAVGSVGGEHVMDERGHCVRTKWGSPSDECGRTIEIAKLEERTVHFDFDSSELDMGDREKLDMLAQIFREHNIKKVVIVGFADRIGKDDYNVKLSERRAYAVKGYLDSKVALESSPVALRGLGSSNQVKECADMPLKELKECLAPNRRVEVEIDYVDTVSEPE
jgi:OOP family OmpA-OmpF porin